jgi:hypothetical protein
MESILESCESKLETLALLLRDCAKDEKFSSGSVISAIVIFDNLLSKFVVLFEKFVSNLKTGIFKRFYKAIESRFLRERMMGSITDIFMSIFEIVRYLMSSIRKKMEYFEKPEYLQDFDKNDLESYLTVYQMF